MSGVSSLSYASKPTPSEDKLRGGYYTPEPIAQYVAQWVAEAGSTLLEPSCGDGAILTHLVKAAVSADSVRGVELVLEESRKASTNTGAEVVNADFFQWFDASALGRFDGVAGNPPFIRFGSWAEESREAALDLMRSQGLKPSKLTNAWVPFVVAAVMAVRPGGRVGLVLPAELLQVGYTAELRAYLLDNCSDVTVVSFRRLIFPGIQQEVVLLLAVRGAGPAQVRTIEVEDASQLDGVDPMNAIALRAELHEREKWTKYYLDPAQIEILRRMRSDDRLQQLRAFGSVDVGVVTGRNAFFCMPATDARTTGLAKFLTPLVARSNQISGIRFTADDLKNNDAGTANTRLLQIPSGFPIAKNLQLAEYVADGEREGVDTGYKCRIRKEWWVVPSVWVPDAFMLRQISTHPRIIANAAGATSTDTVHRVRMQDGVSAEGLSAGAFNSVTFAMSEILGRSYGGGVLELEPSEAEALPVPDPVLVPKKLIPQVDKLVRAGKLDEALDLVDRQVLVGKLGFTSDEVAECRKIWERLRDRRIGRKARVK